MSQYRHDRFAKLYVKALYKTKGNVRENIPVRRTAATLASTISISVKPAETFIGRRDRTSYSRL